MYGCANKGEWSELYALIKLLADGKIAAADADLNLIEDWVYSISSIKRRSMQNENIEYQVLPGQDTVSVIPQKNKVSKIVSRSYLRDLAQRVLAEIKASQNSSFAIAFLDDDMKVLSFPKIKSGSASKRDITVIVHDSRLCRKQEVGFSIKSKLGSPSTLFNAHTNTNFIYEVIGMEGLSEGERSRILSLKTKSLVKALQELGCQLRFKKVQGDVFSSNLRLIDTGLEEILSHVVLSYYGSSAGSGLASLCKKVADINPLGFSSEEAKYFYHHKVKRFLSAAALGMVSSELWSGWYDATGGYIVVKESGELACYHIYNWNFFEEYLLSSTKLDTASTGRHRFGSLENDDGRWILKLNLQVRFSS